MENLIKERRKLVPIRLEMSRGLEELEIVMLMNFLHVKRHQIIVSDAPLDLSFISELRDHLKTVNRSYFYKPLDEEMLRRVAKEHKLIVTLEENVLSGGFGEHVTEYLTVCHEKAHILNIAISDEYVEHGNVDILRQEVGIDADTIYKRILAEFIGL